MSKTLPNKYVFLGLGLITLAWHLMGCFNFVMQLNPENISKMPEAYRAVISERPFWATAAFAVSVFAGLAASILWLLKNGLAKHMFLLSLVGTLLALISALGYGQAVLIPTASAVVFAALFSFLSFRWL